jgi:hypothetical protein
MKEITGLLEIRLHVLFPKYELESDKESNGSIIDH